MDESAKMKLYEQLLEMAKLNQKTDASPIISEEEFMNLPDGLALYYIFEYRDTQTYFEQDGKELVPYIELPSMDLSEKNLEFLYLSKFVLGTFDEDGKIQPSTINLKNTNAMININDLGFNGNRINEFNITEHLLDFSYINFQGCNVFGRLPDEFEEDNKKKLFSKVIISDKEHAFDPTYLSRRKELQERGIEYKKLLDRVYEKIKSGKSLSGTSGIRQAVCNYRSIDLSDYDFSDLDDNHVNYYQKSSYQLKLDEYTGFNLNKQKFNKKIKYILNASKDEIPYIFQIIKSLGMENSMDTVLNIVLERETETQNRKEIVENLIKIGVNVNEQNNDENSALHKTMVMNGVENRKAIAKMLIEAGADVNAEDNKKNTVLHNALTIIDSKNRKEIVEMLLKAKADVNAKNCYGVSVLSSAIAIRDFESAKEIIELLLEAGVNINESDFFDNVNEMFRFQRMVNELGKTDISTYMKEIIDSKIRGIIEDEKNRVEKNGKKIVSADGSSLNKLINDPNHIELDYILKLIELGSNPNYCSYEIDYNGNPTYTPTLYKATRICGSERRKTILRALLKTGVDVNASYKSIDFSQKPPKETIQRCLDANNGELKTLIAELRRSDTQKNVTETNHNVSKKTDVVKKFLQTTVKLSQTQIEELSQTFKKFNRDLEKESTEDLDMKKDILEACDSVRVGFTKYGTILFNPANVLYARLMFFKEQGIKIEPHRLHETMAANKKRFVEKYATMLGLSSNNPEKVKRALLKKYPMPTDKKEFKRKIEELIQGKDAI